MVVATDTTEERQMSFSIFRFRCSFLLVLLSPLFLSFAFASGTIRGRVTDRETGNALPGASVIIQNTTIGAATDWDGRYVIHNVDAGVQTLKISYVGYQSVSLEVTVSDGGEVVQDFRLVAQALEGETVTVTAQARGQQEAINQQLASNTITNIVSAARIKELPDASAAESIGRLPGISIDRYNGEATAVAIRGLAPKYNTVSVNGVSLPATNNNDRSVDLSLISSNLLDGIEVKKANTPDMDADALGGTIDLRLKEASSGFQIGATAQGGYNARASYYGNYNFNLTASNRFFDDELGVIIGFNTDRNNRTADKLNASYTTLAADQIASNLRATNIILQRDETFKDRLGGNLLLDYKIPYGKLSGDGFYSQGRTYGTTRQDNMDFSHQSHYFQLDDNDSKMGIYTGSIGIAQDFGLFKYDASVAATGSKLEDPNDYQWQFSQENNAANGYPPPNTPLNEATKFEILKDSTTGLQYVIINSNRLVESNKIAQLNIQAPFQVSDDISGYIKIGGKLRWLNRIYDRNQWGHYNLQYGTVWTGVVGNYVRAASAMYPNDFSVVGDSSEIAQTNLWNLYRFYRGYKVPSNYLDGSFSFAKSPDLGILRKLTDAIRNLPWNDWQAQPLQTFGQDYDGIERYSAGYIMAEVKLGPYVTFTPGVRYDADYTKYHGQSFREVIQAGSASIPSLTRNENERRNSFWLPMVHLNVVPFDWLHIHLAGTETVTRPDYSMYAPITTIDQYSYSVQAANASLRDSRSKNLDASISIYQNYVGFMSVAGFYKKIDDLVLYEGITKVDTTIYKMLNANLNVPASWLDGSQQINTWVNNSTPAQYRGVEFDWQTHFWYLPSVLQGLIFNLNWTYIVSTIDVRQYRGSFRTQFVPPHTQLTIGYLDSTSRTQRMPDQPAHILNTTIGYDYAGFSIRVSYLYQSDKVTGIGTIPLLDSFTGSYSRWDVSVQQRINQYIQLYVNLNNLNDSYDKSLQGYQEIDPTSLAYYGRTVDAGIRVTF